MDLFVQKHVPSWAPAGWPAAVIWAAHIRRPGPRPEACPCAVKSAAAPESAPSKHCASCRTASCYRLGDPHTAAWAAHRQTPPRMQRSPSHSTWTAWTTCTFLQLPAVRFRTGIAAMPSNLGDWTCTEAWSETPRFFEPVLASGRRLWASHLPRRQAATAPGIGVLDVGTWPMLTVFSWTLAARWATTTACAWWAGSFLRHHRDTVTLTMG